MDFGIIDVVKPLDASLGVPPFEFYEPARYAMGDTRRYAERMSLIEMTPRGDLTSTGYALANVGREYLILQPTEGSFTVDLPTGSYGVEWHSVTTRETIERDALTLAADGRHQFTSPFAAGASVLYLRTT